MRFLFGVTAVALLWASTAAAAAARPLDCTPIAGCSTCQLQRLAGNPITQKVCTACRTGRTLRDGKICDCASGWAFNQNSECILCIKGQYCPGGDAKSNPTNKAFDCPPGTATIIQGAASQEQCLAKPGFGRAATRGPNGKVTISAVLCGEGTYNAGSNSLPCQKCGINLTTAGRGSTSAAQCLAPPGYYKDPTTVRAQRCQRGTYSPALSADSACLPCPAEMTTQAEGSTSAAACIPAV